MVLVALALTVIAGMVALAVDVGHTFERRQTMQNIATSAAEAGAYETHAISALDNGLSQSQEDSLVYNRMVHIVSQYNAAIVSPATYVPNDSCNDSTYSFSANRLYMQAAYLDQNNFYIYVDSSFNTYTVDTKVDDANFGLPIIGNGNYTLKTGVSPLLVGQHVYTRGSYSDPYNGANNQTISGVKVITLGGCVPRFFGGVLGHGDFRVASDAQAGQPDTASTGTPSTTATPSTTGTPTGTATNTATSTSSVTATPTATITGTPTSSPAGTLPPSYTPTNTGTVTPTNTQTSTPTITNTPTITSTPTPYYADFMVWGTPQPSPYPNYPETLFAQGAYDAPTSTTSCPNSASSCSGDLVTIYANSGNWKPDQYGTQSAGLSGVPDGSTSITVHDASMDGCFTSTVPIALNISVTADYNHGGVGHCSTFPNVGDNILVPVVYEVQKNDGSCSTNGGYCEVVEAIVRVLITVSNPPHLVQGYIVGVSSSCTDASTGNTVTNCDPQHIVQLSGQAPLPSGAPPTSTPTNTATATATLISLTLNPTSVTGGSQNSTGTVTLSGAAPAGGVVVTLSSTSNKASVPASVTVPAGSTTATFTVTTGNAGNGGASATISATYNGVTRQAILTLT